ncbi:MAG: DPP IV N-terminal domain-containing protein, partial [Acidobacteriaceae bacterium]|nr:DPP IV N-terminal domain-containing protein [Acidobacteriaceae bacterium]
MMRLARLLTCSIVISVLAFAAGPRKPVTIDDVVSYRTQHGPTPIWTPDGNSFAYEESGTVYLYDIAQRRSTRWFETKALEIPASIAAKAEPYSWKNRRVGDSRFQWFPNGKDLLAVASGGVFIVHPDGKNEQLIGPQSRPEDPKLSPDGQNVLYRSHCNLFVFSIRAHQIRQLTNDGTREVQNGQLDWVYPEELDLGAATWWSPDSKRIAYLQFNIADEFVYPQADLLGTRAISEPERYPQAGTPNAKVRLGVVPVEGGETRWMEAGNSPDVLLARV